MTELLAGLGLAAPVLTAWDAFILLVFVVSVLLGMLRGFIRTVFALGAWLIALIGTPLAGPVLLPMLGLAEYRWVGYLGLFLVLLIGTRLIGGLVARGLRRIGLGGADRGFGGLLGIARAVVIVALAAVVARAAGLHHDTAWRQAASRPLLEKLATIVEPWLPRPLALIQRS